MGDAVEYDAFTAFLYRIDDFMWGTWMTVLLVGIGIILSIRFAFRYQRKIIFNFKNTYGRIGAKGEGEGTISGFRAACTGIDGKDGTQVVPFPAQHIAQLQGLYGLLCLLV